VNKKRLEIIIILAMAVSAGRTAFAQDPKVLSLGLEDCIAKALKNNLAVAVEKLNPGLADIQVTKAR
jgi:hypothetical protein